MGYSQLNDIKKTVNAENVKTHKQAKLHSLFHKPSYASFTPLHQTATILNGNKHSQQCQMRM